jgi:hypothetical protein
MLGAFRHGGATAESVSVGGRRRRGRRAALDAFYDYFGRGEDMLAHITRDVHSSPALAAAAAPSMAFVVAVRDALVDKWNVRGAKRVRLAAVIAHALRFETWHSLARAESLGDAHAAGLMVDLARTVVAPK